MFGPTPKAQQTSRDPIDGTPLYWRGHPDGYAVRSADGPFAVEREAATRARTDLYFQSEVLEMPKDTKRYVQIMDWILNARGVLHKEREREDPQKPGVWHVWLAWVDVRGSLEKSVQMPKPEVTPSWNSPPTN